MRFTYNARCRAELLLAPKQQQPYQQPCRVIPSPVGVVSKQPAALSHLKHFHSQNLHGITYALGMMMMGPRANAA